MPDSYWVNLQVRGAQPMQRRHDFRLCDGAKWITPWKGRRFRFRSRWNKAAVIRARWPVVQVIKLGMDARATGLWFSWFHPCHWRVLGKLHKQRPEKEEGEAVPSRLLWRRNGELFKLTTVFASYWNEKLALMEDCTLDTGTMHINAVLGRRTERIKVSFRDVKRAQRKIHR